MISDRYVLRAYPEDTEKILDVSQHMAACYGFDAKELLLIRLLTEEMISSVHSGLLLVPGELWFAAKDGMFSVTASVCTDVFGIPREQRKKLLNAAKTPKNRGLFGLVREFMDYITEAEDAVSMQDYFRERYSEQMEHFSGLGMDTWHMESLNRMIPKPAPGGPQNPEQDLEITLLKGFADDVRVTSKFGTLEISVMKKIPDKFVFTYLSGKSM